MLLHNVHNSAIMPNTTLQILQHIFYNMYNTPNYVYLILCIVYLNVHVQYTRKYEFHMQQT